MIQHKGESMRVLGYMPLHYGSDYFTEACRAILPAIDELLILYTKEPSYGHKGTVPLPSGESRDELYAQFERLRDFPEAKGKKMIWSDVVATREGSHRDIGIRYAKTKNYHLAVTIDSDEIWETKSLLDCLVEAFNSPHSQFMTSHKGWKHYYRSFYEYCQDGFQPVRIFNFSNYNTSQGCVQSNKIHHMGYAVREEVMKYKLSCHGHKSEMDIDSFFQIWKNYKKDEWESYLENTHRQDVDWTLHPASKQVWLKTRLSQISKLPDLLKEHYFYKEDPIR